MVLNNTVKFEVAFTCSVTKTILKVDIPSPCIYTISSTPSSHCGPNLAAQIKLFYLLIAKKNLLICLKCPCNDRFE